MNGTFSPVNTCRKEKLSPKHCAHTAITIAPEPAASENDLNCACLVCVLCALRCAASCHHSEDVAVDCFAPDPSFPPFSLTMSFLPPLPIGAIFGNDSLVLSVTTGLQRPNLNLTVRVVCTSIPEQDPVVLYTTVLRHNATATVTYDAAPTSVLLRVTCTPTFGFGDPRFDGAYATPLSFDVHPGTQFQMLNALSLPAGRMGAAATVINGKIVTIGGETDAGEDALCFTSFDGSTFTQVLGLLPPIPRSQGALIALGTGANTRLLLLTGSPTDSVGNDTWMLSETGWFRSGSIPGWDTGRSGVGVVSVGSMLWLLGGTTNGSVFYNDVLTAELSVLNDELTWTTWPNAPWAPRANFAAVVFREQLYVIGGNSYSSGIDGIPSYTNDVWRIAASAPWSSWIRQLPMSCSPRAFFSYGVAVNGLAIVGGQDVNGTTLGDMCTFDGTLWHAARQTPFMRSQATTGAMPRINDSLFIVGQPQQSAHSGCSLVPPLVTVALSVASPPCLCACAF